MQTTAPIQINVHHHIKQLTRKVLEAPFSSEWTIQGLGMLRTYLTRDLRLHVWDDEARFENVSTMHTHPWSFTSYVVAGRVEDQTFIEVDSNLDYNRPDLLARFNKQKILCGEGGGLVEDSTVVWLDPQPPLTYEEGRSYGLRESAIHASNPEQGTVTLIHRQFGDDPDHAFVYYPLGQEWVTAEPRQATNDEVARITERALARWF